MQVAEHDSMVDLQRLAKRERDGRVRIRLQGIILGRQGRSSREIGEVLGVSSRSVRDWVKRYQQGGVAALQEQPGRGRRTRLKEQDHEAFRARVDAGAQPDDGVCTLRGCNIKQILEQEFGVRYSVSGVYRLLHRLGYSSLMPRPRHKLSDPQRQDDFKKKSPLK
jgi:transposase